MRTWHFELAVVAATLGAIAVATGGPIEWIGAGAVSLSFAHAQVAERLAEAERERRSYVRMDGIDEVGVACHRWATRYLLGKELLWLTYFVMHRSWTALAGVGMFLAYPIWRRYWRSRKPAVWA